MLSVTPCKIKAKKQSVSSATATAQEKSVKPRQSHVVTHSLKADIFNVVVNGYNLGVASTAHELPVKGNRFLRRATNEGKKERILPDGLIPIIKFIPGPFSGFKFFVRSGSKGKPILNDCVSVYGESCGSIDEAIADSPQVSASVSSVQNSSSSLTVAEFPPVPGSASSEQNSTSSSAPADSSAVPVGASSVQNSPIIFWIDHCYLHGMVHVGCKDVKEESFEYEPGLFVAECEGCKRVRDWYASKQEKVIKRAQKKRKGVVDHNTKFHTDDINKLVDVKGSQVKERKRRRGSHAN